MEEVSTRLVRKGHEVTVYCGSNSGAKYSSYEGVNLINLPRVSSKFLDFPLRCLLSTMDAMPRDFDILHYHDEYSPVFASVPRVLSRTVVITLGAPNWNRSSYPWLAQFLLRSSSRLALYVPHATTVDSCWVREWYYATFGKAPIYIPHGARVMPRGADPVVLQRYGVEEDGYVLFVGRLVSEKGVHHLIRAFNQSGVQSELPLIIVGRDPYGGAYELSLKKIAKKNVRFLGYVYGADMDNLFKGAYLYVSASELEGTSPAVLSAMGFGNCVIVSDIPGNLEAVGDAGVTFKNRDWHDLSDKLSYLTSSPDVVREYRKRAVERITRFYTWDSVAERMERLYLSLTERN